MAITNQERVGKAMELLRAGLAPYVEREFKSADRGRHGSHGGHPRFWTTPCWPRSRSPSGTRRRC
jgi:hypothetical protein